MKININNSDHVSYIGFDFGSGSDRSVTVEIRFNTEGSMEVKSLSEDLLKKQNTEGASLIKDESPFAYPSDEIKSVK